MNEFREELSDELLLRRVQPRVEVDNQRGIVLLASYPTKAVDEPLLLLYGTEDGVLNRERVAEASHYGSVETRVIEGGNHASFGDYGPQAGDRPAAISAREQQEQTLSAIAAWLDTNK